ncbi:carboxypeptidase-like regulatory domain-containing protein [Algoriphagus vanfongensis]|uniref:carboxypeptidase-like regulatory domain-containing protein n=1 Tax=Algoriphagus vanfongensis TaxID=426371 RepID=UPI0004278205|nr:carboxypeptidase-like regulatory domain-containing protein [Algoriphagus vanfongensis]
MKITSTFFLLIWSLFFSLPAISQEYKLTGQVVDSETGAHLDGVSVTLKGTIYGKTSAAGGKFQFSGLESNQYTVSLSLEGYNRLEQIVKLNKDTDLGSIILTRYGSSGSGAALQKSIRTTNIVNLLNERPNFIGGNMIMGIPPEPKTVEGNNYLDEQWNLASILLYRDQQVMEGFRVRYNIVSNMFELMEPENQLISVMPGLRIQNIVWVDSTYKVPRFFVNGMDFLDEGVPISGFFEVLVEGEKPLMRRTLAVLKESNYNTALMVGQKNDEIVKRNYYYYLQGKNLMEIPKNRKKFYLIFGDQADEIKEFADSNNLDVKKASDIFKVFTHYNSQFEGFRPIMSQLLDEIN